MGDQNDSPSTARTVELTSKRLKLHTMLSVMLLIVGGVWLWVAIDADADAMIPGWLTFIGIVWYVVTRIRIWWHHK